MTLALAGERDGGARSTSTAVERWFGSQFAALHPQLQALHRHGGVLCGEVAIACGRGLAGWLGRRLARSMGLPLDRDRRGFEVRIAHEGESLIWSRRFAEGGEMRSVFTPVGAWPDGYWVERTGYIALHLGVDVIDGGWYWRARRAYLRGLRVPLWLLPRTRAGKRVEHGRYVFEVAFVVPGLGEVLRYGGELDLVAEVGHAG